MTKSGRSAGVATVVVLALVAPLLAAGVWVFVASSESPLESSAEAAPLVGMVEAAERFSDTNVTVKVEYAAALAPTTQASGTLTALTISQGEEVVHGQTVMTVDAKEVIAYTADAPLYRDVTRRLEGADIETAQQLLADLGYLDGTVDGTAGYDTEQAIKKFNQAHGYGKSNTILSRDALVWLGSGPVTVGEMAVAVGDAVSPGTELFTTTASMAAIAVTEAVALPQSGDLELDVLGVTAPYTAGSGAVTEPDAVAELAAAIGSAGEGVGAIRLVTPETVGAIPASAVYSDETGATCLFPDTTGAPIAIEPGGGSLGTVDLDRSLVGQSVLLNPREVREELTCG